MMATRLDQQLASLPKEGDALAGKYAIERVVGEGGMCLVYSAQHLQLRQRVAIKVLRPQVRDDPEAVERFMREGRAAIRIRSEYCVRILDVDVLPSGEPYIVMEHLEGNDLEALILANGPSPVTAAVDYILQAGEAIAEAHTLGIVHRDLKPANLFFTRRADGTPWIKVLDFGISKVARLSTSNSREIRLTGRDMVMGSPQYMSPEQLRATRDVDGRADIWSLGAILHELLSGEPPFTGVTVTSVCASIIQDDPPSLSQLRTDVPEGLDNAILRCLEKNPAKRFSSMSELALALSEYASPAGCASAQRIIGIMESALEGSAGGNLVRAKEKQPEWASTDSSFRLKRKRPTSKLRALALVAALLGTGWGVYAYAKTAGPVPLALRESFARISSVVRDMSGTPAETAPPAAATPLPAAVALAVTTATPTATATAAPTAITTATATATGPATTTATGPAIATLPARVPVPLPVRTQYPRAASAPSPAAFHTSPPPSSDALPSLALPPPPSPASADSSATPSPEPAPKAASSPEGLFDERK